jgi:HAMP domain-containing protein
MAFESSNTPREPEPPWWRLLDPVTNLPTRFALVFAGSTVALALALCVLGGSLMRAQIREGIGAHLEGLAFQVSDKFDRAMGERFREIQLTAGNLQIREPGASPDEKRQVLESMQQTLEDYAWIGFADPDGRIIAATRGWDEGGDVSELAWFREGRDQPAAGSLPVLPDLAARLPGAIEDKPRFIAVSSPVYEPVTTRFAGILGAYINWPWVAQVIESVVPSTRGATPLQVTIYDRAGRVLMDSHRTSGANRSEPLAAPEVPREREYRGFMEESTSEGDYLVGYVRSRGYRGFRHLNWFIVVRQPVASAYAPVASFQRSIILSGFGMAAILGAVGWFFALNITRRMRAIASASDRIREGDITSVVPAFRSKDEMARMAESFGHLVGDLRRQNERLQSEVLALRGRGPARPSEPLSAEEQFRALNPGRRRPRRKEF